MQRVPPTLNYKSTCTDVNVTLLTSTIFTVPNSEYKPIYVPSIMTKHPTHTANLVLPSYYFQAFKPC
jgi:hypothetical protein